MKAFLDIETARDGRITVVGIYRPEHGITQLVESAINHRSLRNALGDSKRILTYNGNRFDIPIIRQQLRVDLRQTHELHDLMYDCWRHGLKGGLKRVEQRIGIARQSEGLNGLDAMRLWDEYTAGSHGALETLLQYNRDDVVNLELLEQYFLGRRLFAVSPSIPATVLRSAFG